MNDISALAGLELAKKARDPSTRPPRKAGIAAGDRIADHLPQLLLHRVGHDSYPST
ncbi:MAG TPA: hypothetical protein VG076_15760 [Acidimicrobiales bacterium]|nr:hypothetical protein [Acidimicrobiales bacterium]